MTDDTASCPKCGTAVTPSDRFCEGCGVILTELRSVAIPRTEDVAGPCADCGNDSPFDEYCTVCGHRREEPDRDQAEIGTIALITDRGLVHARNEDAAAGGAVAVTEADWIAVAVCDGVSTSGDAHMASAAASNTAVQAMLSALASTRNARAAVLAGLTEAAKAAAAAISADSSASPSCTYTAAVVIPTAVRTAQITYANVGDSRAYWLPEPPAVGQQLTVDDSLAQELITAGASAQSDAVLRGAHTLTRWLGADSEARWSKADVHTFTPQGRGWLLLCSDGLWNYLPDATDIARLCAGLNPAMAARVLVDYAVNAGGEDNITVAIVPIGELHEFS